MAKRIAERFELHLVFSRISEETPVHHERVLIQNLRIDDGVVVKTMMLVLMLMWTAMERLFGIAAPVVAFTVLGAGLVVRRR